MKLSKLFLMGVVVLGLGLTACNNDVPESGPDVKSNTLASLQISTAKSMFRATQADETGRAAESTVAFIDLLSDVANKSWSALVTAGTSPADYPAETANFFNLTNGVYTVSPWKTVAGSQNMALLLNGGSLSNKGAIATAADYTIALSTDPIADFSTDDSFVMSSKTFAANVLPNISQTMIENKTNTQNVFGTDVERVVCQGIVVNGAPVGTDYTAAATTDNKGALSGLKYGGAMGASKTYLYASHAGDRTMTGTPLDYQGYTSAIHNVAVSATEPTNFTTGDGLNFAKAELTNLATVQAFTGTPTARGFYFLENSMALPASNTDWKYTRSAYAKVYGVYTPAEVWERAAGDALVFVAKAGTGLWYDTANPGTPPQTSNTTGTLTEGYVKSDKALVKNTTFTAGTTFYKGELDGLFYATPEAAFSSVNAPGQKSFMYENGKCVYRSLWNRIDDGGSPSKTLNGNTRRNNIYVLNVTAFAKVGMNYDPNDPADPNIPKPTNPYEPATPQDGSDPTVDQQDTYMRVQATILPWNKVSRDIVLQ